MLVAGSILDTIPIQVVNEGWRCVVCCGTAMRCQTLLGVPAVSGSLHPKEMLLFFSLEHIEPDTTTWVNGKTARSEKKISGCATTNCVISMIIADSHTITRI